MIPFTLEKTNSVYLFCVLGKEVTRKRLGNSLFHLLLFMIVILNYVIVLQRGRFEYKQTCNHAIFTVQTTPDLPWFLFTLEKLTRDKN